MFKPNKNLKALYTAYGGLAAVLRSWYFRVAVCFGIGRSFGRDVEKWADLIQSVVPSMLGFSLGAYAMLLAFGSEKFQKILVKAGSVDHESGAPGIPVFVRISASFAWFIIVQAITLILALIAPPVLESLGELCDCPESYAGVDLALAIAGWIALFYSILLGIAATMWIFRMSRWFCDISKSAFESRDRSANDPDP